MRSAAPRSLLALILISLLAGACGGSSSPATEAEERRQVLQQRFPDIVGASFDPIGDTTWSVRVTLSSPYDSEDRYADAWRVLLPNGTVLGTRQLTHDHAAEQPFTRALNNVEIPEDTQSVLIEGHDLINGWSEDTIEFDLPERKDRSSSDSPET
jgi:hypothetical protein